MLNFLIHRISPFHPLNLITTGKSRYHSITDTEKGESIESPGTKKKEEIPRIQQLSSFVEHGEEKKKKPFESQHKYFIHDDDCFQILRRRVSFRYDK